jgi:hypothetical protein
VWLDAAGGEGKDCKAELKQLNEIVAGWGRLARAAAVNLTSEQVEPGSLGLDLGKLRAGGCGLQLGLAPFGEKGDPDEWAPYTGAARARPRLPCFSTCCGCLGFGFGSCDV